MAGIIASKVRKKKEREEDLEKRLEEKRREALQVSNVS